MSENNPYFKKLKGNGTMKKTVILIAAAIALLTGCATEQPPPADSPEPPAHSGKFVSEYGSMTFNGDGESVIIDFQQELADATGLPTGAAEGQYVFTFQQGMYRYDKADSFELIIGEFSYSFLSNFQETNENRICVLSPCNSKSHLIFEKDTP